MVICNPKNIQQKLCLFIIFITNTMFGKVFQWKILASLTENREVSSIQFILGRHKGSHQQLQKNKYLYQEQKKVLNRRMLAW